MMNFCLADHRDNFYKNYRLQNSKKPWFYFCQVSFPWLLLFSLRDAFSKAKEQVCPHCWGSVMRATNTYEGGTGFAPSFCYSLRLYSKQTSNPGMRQVVYLLSPLCYLICGIGDEKIWGREKVIGEIHQRANKTNEQSSSGTNRSKCCNAEGNSTEHNEKEENNIQGMWG